ncbi:MAG TPA: hypothetical protein VFV58_14010 [Blastocatellia bacterium]|jgi:hypothetical protein|nr:hypothetical protein [Blastocatellia bacterium]
MTETICQSCGARAARRYQLISFGEFGEPGDERESMLCARCARAERLRLNAQPDPGEGLSRQEMIAALDRFFESSGVFDICRRCHEQGTGCCPPTCRVMGTQGCNPNNKYGKSVFCAAFVCGALLNAISECDAEAGRALKWVKTEIGAAEFHIYEMITRVPPPSREPVRPLALPRRYPHPKALVALENGAKIKEKLDALASEVLEIRRRWRELERQEINDEPRKSEVER